MEPIQDFAGLICRLRSLKERKRVVVVCPNDPHTEYVITRSLHEGFADFLLVADTPHLLNSEYIRLQYPDHVKVYEATSPDKAAQEAVSLIREGHADVLMKGIINTDNLLRAVLNKEHGILPKGNVLSHITVAQIPMYKKLLFFSDAAVIPRPTLEQFEAMLRYDLEVCRRMGIEAPCGLDSLYGKSKREIPSYTGLCDFKGTCRRRCLRKHVLGRAHGCEDGM